MIEGIPSRIPTVLRRVFYGTQELRAGWRLFIFVAIVIALINASNLLVRRLLHGADDTTLFLVREVMDFLIFILASWLMGRIEDRTVADYGLPWRMMFRPRFWQGALLGCAAIGLHMAFDWGETFFYGVPDSGQLLPGTLLTSSSSGPAWLSGGSVGPEGSVLCTLLILALWLICAVWLREVKYPKPAAVQQ